MIKELQIKCVIEGHDFVELACLNEKCKANRVYYHQCLKNGDHVAHMKDQKDLKELIEFFQEVEQENGSLISKLSLMLGEIIKLFNQLNQGLEQKYQFSKDKLLMLNSKQLNQALDQVIIYDEIKKGQFEEKKKCSNDIIISLKKYIKELKLGEVNYFSSKQQEQGNVEELYQQGCKLYDDDKYEETIKLLDAALLINPKHFSSLYIKADSLKMLGNYKDAIRWQIKLCRQIQNMSIHYLQKVNHQECWVNIPKLVKFVIKHQMLIHIMINPQGVKEPVYKNCQNIQKLLFITIRLFRSIQIIYGQKQKS
ncbi:unnamed protein product [Paramecium pentaurelia]|uniref:Tetratricopeptide repeat protein n=1 Tax=Paramecium pentaurelia TaxID=43138 RepID=A0A8S1Y542_9CILI|nr:unnamed protein product [Paramecium pentaurelia]